MNIVMTVSNAYTHDPRVRREAEALVQAGHKVNVIAWDETGEFPEREIISGVCITRIRNTLFMNLARLGLIKLILWRREALKMLMHSEGSWLHGVNAIHCHDLSSLPIGVKFKNINGKIPLIYDAHEIWGYMVSFKMPWWKRYIKMEKRLVQSVDVMLTVSEPLHDYFEKFFGNENYPDLCQKPIFIIKNCKEYNGESYHEPTERTFTLFYAGGLSEQRQILEMIDAVGNIEGLRFIVAGSGTRKYNQKIYNHCSKVFNAFFIGKIPPEQVIPMTKECHATIFLGNETLNMTMGLPNKLFESMVSGRPFISTRGTYRAEYSVKRGFGVPVSDTKELVIELKKLIADPERCRQMGMNAIECAKEENWENEKKKLITIYGYLQKWDGRWI